MELRNVWILSTGFLINPSPYSPDAIYTDKKASISTMIFAPPSLIQLLSLVCFHFVSRKDAAEHSKYTVNEKGLCKGMHLAKSPQSEESVWNSPSPREWCPGCDLKHNAEEMV
ncbi:unnamed protein product [Natator depressus]